MINLQQNERQILRATHTKEITLERFSRAPYKRVVRFILYISDIYKILVRRLLLSSERSTNFLRVAASIYSVLLPFVGVSTLEHNLIKIKSFEEEQNPFLICVLDRARANKHNMRKKQCVRVH